MRAIPVPCYMDNYAWILYCEQWGEAVVIDPSEGIPVVNALKDLHAKVTAVYCTHHHADHIDGMEELLQFAGKIPVYCHEAAMKRIPAATKALEDGDALSFCGRKGKVIYTPGHTLGSSCFQFEEFLFTGDTLFSAGCGRIFEGDVYQMAASLDKFAQFAGDTKVCCGHEYTLNNLAFARTLEPARKELIEREKEVQAMREKGEPSLPSTFEIERRTNPFLRSSDPSLAVVACKEYGAKSDSADDVFAAIRRARDNF